MHAIIRALLVATLSCVTLGLTGAQAQVGGLTTNPESTPDQNPRDGGDAPSGTRTLPKPPPQDLDRSGGVIEPPATEDSGAMPPPHQELSRTPVLTPPKTSDGDPEAKPK